MASDVSTDRSAFIFRVKYIKHNCACLPEDEGTTILRNVDTTAFTSTRNKSSSFSAFIHLQCFKFYQLRIDQTDLVAHGCSTTGYPQPGTEYQILFRLHFRLRSNDKRCKQTPHDTATSVNPQCLCLSQSVSCAHQAAGQQDRHSLLPDTLQYNQNTNISELLTVCSSPLLRTKRSTSGTRISATRGLLLRKLGRPYFASNKCGRTATTCRHFLACFSCKAGRASSYFIGFYRGHPFVFCSIYKIL